jgi:hypothetical protein
MATRKTCSACQRTLRRDSFGCNLSAPDGLSWYCRECANEKQREWKAANPDKIAKWRKAYIKRTRARNGAEA